MDPNSPLYPNPNQSSPAQPGQVQNPNNVGQPGTGNTGIAGPPQAQPAAPAPPPGGFDAEKFRKGWAYGGAGFGSQTNIGELQKFITDNPNFAGGVTLKGEKVYDPQGKFMFDAIGNYTGGDPKNMTRIALQGNSPYQRGKTPPKGKGPISPPGPGNLPPKGVGPISPPGPGNLPPTIIPPIPPPSGTGGSIAPIRDPRLNDLYNTLMDRSKQSLNIDRNDPIIRAQADAFSANQERSRRNDINSLAESEGPNANLRSEQRMGAERAGQASGAFEAELMGRELGNRRQEISEALNSAQGLLTEEQRLALTNELTRLNDATQRYGINTGASTQRYGIDTQNKQFYSGLGQQNRQFDKNLGFQRYSFDKDLGYRNRTFDADLGYRNRSLNQNDEQFRDRLGFDYGDRSNYWDALNRGIL